ncbi:NAD(P)/FAD-dependent oxidoreductase [Devosia sp.]|uniref:NAD(P)/FAD-dependent oxidoreductase n=1 Tax=Devosia sp. TaxID=1871048 RepID=UPI003A941406
MTRIAIIGAGIGGISLAHQLARSHEVVVFEKGRGVGGRMATRYAPPFSFDHGAQYFTLRDPRFAHLLEPLLATGAVAPWAGPIARIEDGAVTRLAQPRDLHHVGVPNMNSMAKALADGLDLRTGVDIAPLGARMPEGWVLTDTSGADQGRFDWVVSTTTAHQTMALFADNGPADGPLTTAKMAPCYALMLGFTTPLDLPWVAARVSASPIEWIGVNSSKPGRDVAGTTIVVHSTSDWAAAHLGEDLGELGHQLGAALHAATGIDPDLAAHRATHRWASARRLPQDDSQPYVDTGRQLAATGDWTTGSRIEDTVLSALDLAKIIDAA